MSLIETGALAITSAVAAIAIPASIILLLVGLWKQITKIRARQPPPPGQATIRRTMKYGHLKKLFKSDGGNDDVDLGVEEGNSGLTPRLD